jgi:DNA-binding SARP family transcriptional activator
MALLGPPRIEVDGDPLSVDTRKAIAVLAHVAVAGPQSRDHLAALLWPGSDQTRARRALRRTMSVLNKALGERWLFLEGQTVDLDAGERWIDVEEFERLRAAPRGHEHRPTEPCGTCVERLERAVALHRGELLEGFSVRDASNFDDWQFGEGERLRRELAMLLDRLVNAHAQAHALAPLGEEVLDVRCGFLGERHRHQATFFASMACFFL